MAAEINNKYAQEWTLENATPRFQDALEFAETDPTCLCLQDAIYFSAIPYTTFYQLAKDHNDLNSIKENIHAAIIRRINKNALKSVLPAPSAASIWRMKQLGEKDQQFIDNTNRNANLNITVQSDEDKKLVDDLKKKFEDE